MATETRYTRPARTVETGYTLGVQLCETGYTRAALTVETGYDAQPSGGTAPVNTIAPAITGTMRLGQTLTCDGGTWTGDPTPTLAYQWQIDAVDVGGATSATWDVTAAGLYGEVTCVVTATNGVSPDASATSNGMTSPLKAIWDIDPDAAAWVRTAGWSVSVGAAESAWSTADGRWTWEQASGTAQPTRGTTGLICGGDDWMSCDSLAGRCDGAHTAVVGWELTTDASTSARTLWCVAADDASASTYQVSLNYSRPDATNATRMRCAWAAASGTLVTQSLISLAGKGTGPYLLAQVSEAPGAAARVESLDTPLVEVGSLTRPAGSATYEWLTLGARRLGAGPTISQAWLGTIHSYVLLSLACSDAQLEAIRDALAAEDAL